jgi:hypothetical protein
MESKGRTDVVESCEKLGVIMLFVKFSVFLLQEAI